MEEVISDDAMIDDMFYLDDILQRRLFLNDDITQNSVHSIVGHILRFNREDRGVKSSKRAPIILYITSDGGEVDAAFKLIDTIRVSKTPVYTVNLGYQYSTGFLVGIAGHRRFTMPNAKFLMHDGEIEVGGTSNKIIDTLEFNKAVEQRIKEYVVKRSKLTSEEYDSKTRIEWYMFADEAKKYGFTDYIVGVDCDIDTIL